MKVITKLSTIEPGCSSTVWTQEGDWVLFEAGWHDYPLWAAHRCYDQDAYMHCMYSSLGSEDILECHWCGEKAPEYFKSMIKLIMDNV